MANVRLVSDKYVFYVFLENKCLWQASSITPGSSQPHLKWINADNQNYFTSAENVFDAD